MIKKILIGLYIFACVLAVFSAPSIKASEAGASEASEDSDAVLTVVVQCKTYQCYQAQQEIQYLYDAIWRESQKRHPNYAEMNQAQSRINELAEIK